MSDLELSDLAVVKKGMLSGIRNINSTLQCSGPSDAQILYLNLRFFHVKMPDVETLYGNVF